MVGEKFTGGELGFDVRDKLNLNFGFTKGTIAEGANALDIDWENETVPGSQLTYAEKHGSLDQCFVQVITPSVTSMLPNAFKPTDTILLVLSDTPRLIIDNQAQLVHYIIF
jgi:hypothetical protein